MINKILLLIDKDMEDNPDLVVPFPVSTFNRIKNLVGDLDIDLDKPLDSSDD